MFSRKMIYSAMVLALSGVAVAATSTDNSAPRGFGDTDPLAYDRNGNGRVSKAELLAARTAEFTAADTDADGSLSLTESQALSSQQQTDRFTALDADGSGALSQEEFLNGNTDDAILSEIFALADSNADGSLSAEEFAAVAPGNGSAVLKFVFLDSNHDQSVSEDEYVTARPGKGHRHGHRHRGGSNAETTDGSDTTTADGSTDTTGASTDTTDRTGGSGEGEFGPPPAGAPGVRGERGGRG